MALGLLGLNSRSTGGGSGSLILSRREHRLACLADGIKRDPPSHCASPQSAPPPPLVFAGSGASVAPYIASSGATGQGNYVTQAYTQQLCQLSQTAYPTVLSDAATAEQQALTTAEQQVQRSQAVGTTTSSPATTVPVLPAPSDAPHNCTVRYRYASCQ